ncbi:MAG TPA: 30S ribosome-binding factor RbfA [Kiloniellales bacterium]|nr:30S ribosome-binding factor RbfA [Kiloniellales bacterium]
MNRTRKTRSPASGERSQRQLRVGEELRHRLAAIFERETFADPQLAGQSITVTEVRVSPDLANATAFVTPLGGRDMEKVVRALNHAAGFLRHLVAQDLDLRVAPRLAFEADRSFDAASRVEEILRHPKVAQDLASDPADDDTKEPD